MQNHIVFAGDIAGGCPSTHYLTVRVTPVAIKGRRPIAAHDLIALLSLEDERKPPSRMRAVWEQRIAPSFASEGEAVEYHAFARHYTDRTMHEPRQPVLTLKQAFQLILRMPTTPRIQLHRGMVAQTLLQFFADLEPSVAEAKQSAACAALLPRASCSHVENAEPDDDEGMSLPARLADAQTALLRLINKDGAPCSQSKRQRR